MNVLPPGEVTIRHLLDAYRKAKADVFVERSQPYAIDFARFETNLFENITKLQDRLSSKDPNWFNDPDFIGSFGYLPKGLEFKGSKGKLNHFTDSRADRNWKSLIRDRKCRPSASFRPVAHFTVEMYIISALWLNLVGHKFDACCGLSARGSRLRRYHNPDPTTNTDKSSGYHLTAVGSFQPYFEAYKKWRGDGLTSIRNHLENDKSVIAVTMDITAFYHSIDPSFILNEDFLTAIKFEKINGPLSATERALTSCLIEAFRTWAMLVPDISEEGPVGVPVGPSASRVFANCLLCAFDAQMNKELSPIYYGRYVDDIFLVLRDFGAIDSSRKFIKYLTTKISSLELTKGGDLRLNLKYAGMSKLIFKQSKQKLFLLAGASGLDLIENIESQINAVSSEWRMLPDLEDLEKSPSAKILTASNDPNQEVDALRKADVISIRRLGFALMLRSCHTAAEDLPPHVWVQQRIRFYRFANEHVLNPLRLLDLQDYIPRLVALAVTCSDWAEATQLVRKLQRVITQLRKDIPGNDEKVWDAYTLHTQTALTDAVAKSIPIEYESTADTAPLGTLLDEIESIYRGTGSRQITTHGISVDTTLSLAKVLQQSDLATVPYKKFAILAKSDEVVADEPTLAVEKEYPNEIEMIKRFVKKAKLTNTLILPLLFPTRPFTTAEITDLIPSTIKDVDKCCKYAEALRGTHPKPSKDIPPNPNKKTVRIGDGPRKQLPTIALPSMLIDESSWCQAANGTPDLSLARYSRLVKLANSIVKSDHKPDYVVFPELSIPRRWASRLASHFTRARISVIAGLEYHFKDGHVLNESKLYLTDNRLGYPSHCVITQVKSWPAPHERSELREKFGLSFPLVEEEVKKQIFDHYGFCFGVLICSELTNIDNRSQFRGEVDAAFVLSWNRDLDSFASLVDSSALDAHCFMVLVNNRKYGDSRVRAPYRENWQRDAVRIKGGLDDFFVVAQIDCASLRDFQSHYESPPAGLFKPVPEGFKISSNRRIVPLGNS